MLLNLLKKMGWLDIAQDELDTRDYNYRQRMYYNNDPAYNLLPN
jgi:hypothetical protein